ncbi:MAG TPA: helix-turn-helix transcriptional regulator [Pirellulales bacterium]|nr:helix-turn-helix transcriptional regulator [Pirellulales bacterium]
MTFTESIRHAIETSGQSCYRIGKETGIDTATLSRFMHGKGGLSMPNLDALAEHLGWTISVGTWPAKKRSK